MKGQAGFAEKRLILPAVRSSLLDLFLVHDIPGSGDCVREGVTPVPRPPVSCSWGHYALISINN